MIWQRILCGLVIVGFIFYNGVIYNWNISSEAGGGTIDLAVFYVAGSSITGYLPIQPIEIYNSKIIRPLVRSLVPAGGTHFLYPPSAAVLFGLFSFVSLPVLAVVWSVLNTLFCLAAFYSCIVFLLKDKMFYRWQYSLTLLFIGLGSPMASLMRTGQINGLIWLLLVVGLIGMVKKQPTLTGIALGTAAMIKLFPLIFLPYLLLKKQYRAAVYFIVTMLSWFLISLPWFGLHGWRVFLTDRLGEVVQGTSGTGWKSISLYGSVRDAIRLDKLDWLGINHHTLNRSLETPYLILSVGIMLLVSWVILKNRRAFTTQKILLDFSLILAALLLVGRIVHHEYVLWLVPAIIFMIRERIWNLVAGMIIILMFYSWIFPELLFGILKPVTLGLIVLFVSLIIFSVKQYGNQKQ